MPAVLLDPPAVLDWEHFYELERRENGQGEHRLFIGPTQSGKSLLARELVLHGRKFVVVMGTKPKDKTLDEYIEAGFIRIDHWPPIPKDFRDQQPGMARFILWPKIKEIGDALKHRPLYKKALDAIYVDGNWTVVVDETLFFSDKAEGLGLGATLAMMAYGGASNGISMMFLMQRPAGVPRT